MRFNSAAGYILLVDPGEYVVVRHAMETGLKLVPHRRERHPSIQDNDISLLREQLDAMPLAVSMKERVLPIGITPMMGELALKGLSGARQLEQPHAREVRQQIGKDLAALLHRQA